MFYAPYRLIRLLDTTDCLGLLTGLATVVQLIHSLWSLLHQFETPAQHLRKPVVSQEPLLCCESSKNFLFPEKILFVLDVCSPLNVKMASSSDATAGFVLVSLAAARLSVASFLLCLLGLLRAACHLVLSRIKEAVWQWNSKTKSKYFPLKLGKIDKRFEKGNLSGPAALQGYIRSAFYWLH